MGEPAGIGGELALSAWLRRAEGTPVFALIDDPRRIAALAHRLDWPVPVGEIAALGEAAGAWDSALPVLPQTVPGQVVPGRPDKRNAGAVIAAIERAVALAQSGAAAAVVTNPIQKQALIEAGFAHPGHTEFLAALAGPGTVPVMMLACPGLRVVPVTVHTALRDAIASIDVERIVTVSHIAAAALRRDFAVARPRLAVAGLNPHAGEHGAFGREEIEIIAPAVARLRDDGLDVAGPLSPDTMFHPAARARYDAAICMYHDQALIPLKTIDFAHGVNVTLGLPFVRTSPDHGTALDLAGTGRADPASLIAALELAAEMAAARGRA
ncbi:MAG TPA: 4-hydroxythreonine-4-phosphate dehydrogenase PdxA [Stellaceae bacterium]|nr:4-hydroxythreonine-4-phosphate dehydrogenase PdxA [Stellaceae bacterium]